MLCAVNLIPFGQRGAVNGQNRVAGEHARLRSGSAGKDGANLGKRNSHAGRGGHAPVQQKCQQQIGEGTGRCHGKALPCRTAGDGFFRREAEFLHFIAVFTHRGDIASEGKP